MSMYAEERQGAMAQRISAEGRMSVAALARDFEVTTETVRRDLSALERRGVVRRMHGGAVPASALRAVETGVADRTRTHAQAKSAIARRALHHLPPAGSTVLLDAGTTTAAFAAALPSDTALTVITHSVPIASRLAGHPRIELHLLPGRVRPTTLAAVGTDTVAALAPLRVDVAFVGANGVTAARGLSTPDADEAHVKSAIVRAARSIVVLADSSKIGEEQTRAFAGTDEVDALVTSQGAEADEIDALRAAGWEIDVA